MLSPACNPRARATPIALVAVLVLAGCGRGLPELPPPTPAAQAVAPLPSPGCRAGTLAAADGARGEMDVRSEQRTWLLDAPAAPADRPLPLVLAFHGFRGSARTYRWWTGLGAHARREQFIAVHPDGHEGVALLRTTGRGWDMRLGETRDLEFVAALLDRLAGERCVDLRRVYAMGMSNGGFFTNLLACQLGQRLAAVAAVAGAMPLACAPPADVAVLLVHGAADRIVSPTMVRSAHAWWVDQHGCGGPAPYAECVTHTGCSAPVVYCEGRQGHWWPPGAAATIWRFFAAHPRPAGPPPGSPAS